MRVIAGKARRIQLKTIDGLDTRPTTDRIKETLFNMLQNDIPGSNVLDLFAGSGAIGIEALSRGAKFCAFAEKSPKVCMCIRDNLEATRLAENAVVMECDVLTAIKRLENRGIVYDIIFMDPPYDTDAEKIVLNVLKDSPLVDEYTTIIVEASLATDFSYLNKMGWTIDRIKNYKTNKHVFIQKI